jgi:hypothetical protein
MPVGPAGAAQHRIRLPGECAGRVAVGAGVERRETPLKRDNAHARRGVARRQRTAARGRATYVDGDGVAVGAGHERSGRVQHPRAGGDRRASLHLEDRDVAGPVVAADLAGRELGRTAEQRHGRSAAAEHEHRRHRGDHRWPPEAARPRDGRVDRVPERLDERDLAHDGASISSFRRARPRCTRTRAAGTLQLSRLAISQ